MAGDNPYGEGELIDALRISDAEWYACVRQMDLRAMQQNGANEKRNEERQPYRNIARIILSIRCYDGRLQQFKVRAYDLSRTGLGFLHGAYVYEGSEAELLMQHHVNGMVRIPATIVSCVHVKKRIHQVGAKFDKPIELADFLMGQAG